MRWILGGGCKLTIQCVCERERLRPTVLGDVGEMTIGVSRRCVMIQLNRNGSAEERDQVCDGEPFSANVTLQF